MQVPGVVPVTATALVATVGNAHAFKNGRQLAVWLGLVPRQHSSGGTRRLGRITKRGDVYLRTLLIHGARAGRENSIGAPEDNQNVETLVMFGDREGFGGRWHGEYRWLSECRSGDGSCRGSESH
jgi:transposase